MTTIESQGTVTVDCEEPACEYFASGHEMYSNWSEMGDEVEHETSVEEVGGWLASCTRFAHTPSWTVSITEFDADPDQADLIAASLLRVAAACRELNRR